METPSRRSTFVSVGRPTPGTPGPRRLGSLTGLRAVAAAVVFVYHLRNTGVFADAPQGWLNAVFGAGYSAVSLFFVLSGFVLAWTRARDSSFTASWWNRAVRIVPLHVLTVALALVLGASLVPLIRTADPVAAVANLFLVSAWRADWWQAGNPVSWSLVCEAFFYAVFPFLFDAIARIGRGGVVVVAVLAVTLTWLVPVLIPVVVPSVSAYSNPLARLHEFVLGVSLAVLMRSHGWRGPRLAVAVPLALLGYAAASALPGSGFAAAAFTVVGFGALVAALARADSAGRRTGLSGPIAVRLGDVSFAFYLVHLLALQSVAALLGAYLIPEPWGAVVVALTALGVASVAAMLLHHVVERPVARGLRRDPGREPRSGIDAVSTVSGR